MENAAAVYCTHTVPITIMLETSLISNPFSISFHLLTRMKRSFRLALSRRFLHAAREQIPVRRHIPSPYPRHPTLTPNTISHKAPPALFAQQRTYCERQDGTDDPIDGGETGLEDIARPDDYEDTPMTPEADAGAQYIPEERPDDTAAPAAGDESADAAKPSQETGFVKLEACPSPPSRLFQNFSIGTKVYMWHTTAKYGRRLMGPMMEWAQEFTYRTGVSVQWEPTYPEKIYVPPSGTPDSASDSSWYAHRDDVEVTVYFFGSQRAIDAARSLMEEMATQEPVLVRVGIFKRQDNGAPPRWLALRRVNNEGRPEDIPAITLKTPGKFALLFESMKEAAVRSVYEETGVKVTEEDLTPTGYLDSMPIEYYWRPKVHYFVAELPADAEVLGPRTSVSDYFVEWDNNILRQSPDPIDRVWASYADPKTGVAWLTAAKLDELQQPVKGDDYMATRYTVGEHLPELRAATQL